MRFREFRPLFESTENSLLQKVLMGLETLAKSIGQKPESAVAIDAEIDSIEDKVQGSDLTSPQQPQLAKQSSEPEKNNKQKNYNPDVIGNEPLSEESTSVNYALGLQNDLMDAAEKLKQRAQSNKKPTKQELLDILSKIQQAQEKVNAFEQEVSTQAKVGLAKEQAGFENNLSQKVDRLIDKVFDTLEILPTEKEKSGAVVSQETKSAAAKKAKEAGNTRKSATRLVKGIITDLSAGVENLEDRAERQKNVLDFLDRLYVGIIDMEALLVSPQDNLDKYIDTKDPIMIEFYHEIVDELIGSAPITTAGAWGPGELALAVLGKPASKSQDKGDVKVGLKKIEVKTAKDAGKGGRIGGNGVNNGGSMASSYKQLLQNFVTKVFNKKYQVTNPTAKNYLFTYTWKNKKGEVKSKTTGATGVGINWFNAFNQKIVKVPDPDILTIQGFLLELVKLGIKQDYWGVIDKNAVIRSVSPDGTINYQQLWKAYAISAFKAYQVADGVDTIMMLNSETRTYTLFNDSKQLSKLLKSGAIIPNPTLMAFSGQTSLGPQMGIN